MKEVRWYRLSWNINERTFQFLNQTSLSVKLRLCESFVEQRVACRTEHALSRIREMEDRSRLGVRLACLPEFLMLVQECFKRHMLLSRQDEHYSNQDQTGSPQQFSHATVKLACLGE